MEALLRWQHPLGPGAAGRLHHARRAHGSHRTTDAVRVDRSTISASGRAFRHRLSINVSARNLQDRRFPSSVLKALDEASLVPDRLELESPRAPSPASRSGACSPSAHCAGRRAGGHRRLRYRLLVVQHAATSRSTAKIDASFVDGIAYSERQQHLVKAIVALAKGWGSRPSRRVSRPSSRGSPCTTWAAMSPRATSSAGRCHCRVGRMARHPPIDVGLEHVSS
jgi:hypothetical protein